MKKRKIVLILMVTLIGVTISCKKKKEDDPNPDSSEGKTLIIKNGAQTVNKGKNITFQAVFIDQDGKETAASGVTWSSSNSELSISSSGLVETEQKIGTSVITAKVTSDGVDYSADVPLSVQDASAITVVPSAVMWSINSGTIPLTTVYMGTGNPSYSFTSSDESIASVSNSGEISFHKSGNCVITVSVSGLSGSPEIQVPVVVWGDINPALPIARVEVYESGVSTQSVEMVREQTIVLSAKAFDIDGKEVSASFSWSTTDTDIATVDQSGNIIGHKIGKTYVQATASGMIGQAEVNVYPDTVIVVDPFWVSNASAGGTQQFSADFYKFDLNTKALNPTPITAPGSVTWELLPTAIITDFTDPFNPTFSFTSPATVTSNGMVTVKSEANIGDIVLLTASYGPTVGIGVGTMTIGF